MVSLSFSFLVFAPSAMPFLPLVLPFAFLGFTAGMQ